MRPGEKLYDAITQVRDVLVEEAAAPGRGKPPWRRWAAAAAAAALAVGAGGYGLSHLLGGRGGGPGAGGGGHANGGSAFMSYAGPVFPLTVLEGSGGLSASRALTYDFAPWIPTWVSNEAILEELEGLTEEELAQAATDHEAWFPEGGHWSASTDLLVTDSYTLTNTAREDRALTLLYPFTASFRGLAAERPTLTADGEELETVLCSGAYSGGFSDVDGGAEAEGAWKLAQIDSWEDYKLLLESGAYRASALGDGPDVTGIPVTVYRFTDAYAPERSEEAQAPTLSVRFDLDAEKTTVLSYGFQGGAWNEEEGWMLQSFSVGRAGEGDYGASRYLILLGEHVDGYTLQGYRNGACEAGNELDGVGAVVTRYETDLDAVLRQVTAEYAARYQDSPEGTASYLSKGTAEYELYYRSVCQLLEDYGAPSGQPVERYADGRLDDLLSEAASIQRVFYLKSTVTVPAGETLAVSAELTKSASFDYCCAHTENQGISGYDMVTGLDTCLSFDSITAELVNGDAVEIVRQNYGFDLAAGIRRVELDPAVEHYYLEVRRAQERE